MIVALGIGNEGPPTSGEIFLTVMWTLIGVFLIAVAIIHERERRRWDREHRDDDL